MKIIACLGNPEKKYRFNRHNAGFLAGTHFAEIYSVDVNRKGYSALYGLGSIQDNEYMLLFPQTYMNNSGESVAAALNFYKEKVHNLLVIHDDIELKFGEIKHKRGGGHKGQNGLRSIIQLAGSPDFERLRIGVGRPEHPDVSVADYVLADFSSTEKNELVKLMPAVDELIVKFIVGSI